MSLQTVARITDSPTVKLAPSPPDQPRTAPKFAAHSPCRRTRPCAGLCGRRNSLGSAKRLDADRCPAGRGQAVVQPGGERAGRHPDPLERQPESSRGIVQSPGARFRSATPSRSSGYTSHRPRRSRSLSPIRPVRERTSRKLLGDARGGSHRRRFDISNGAVALEALATAQSGHLFQECAQHVTDERRRGVGRKPAGGGVAVSPASSLVEQPPTPAHYQAHGVPRRVLGWTPRAKCQQYCPGIEGTHPTRSAGKRPAARLGGRLLEVRFPFDQQGS